MQFNKAIDYAIRILHYLHSYTHRGDVPTAEMISQEVRITYPYFIKIASQLKQKGLVASVQGRHGGYRIARPGHKISLYDVVLAVQGELKIHHCLDIEKQCSRKVEHCAMKDYFQEVQETLVDKLSSKYISDFDIAWQS